METNPDARLPEWRGGMLGAALTGATAATGKELRRETSVSRYLLNCRFSYHSVHLGLTELITSSTLM
jgi:hypothetical protein